jgi:hypothetical protein
VLFVALGVATRDATGNKLWLWCGAIAALGATINYAISVAHSARAEAGASGAPDEITPPPPGLGPWLLYAFRELSRADFCFIVLTLTVFKGQWLLLPATAIGSQAYWMAALIKSSRRFHV